MARTKDSGAIRLFLAAVLLAVVVGGVYLCERGGIGIERLGGVSVPAEVAGLLGTASDSVSNAWTTTKVKTALVLSKRVSAHDVDVESYRGEVTLTGEVPNARAKAAALSIAADIAGVQRVIDGLRIASSSPSAGPDAATNRRVADLEIQVRLYQELLGDDVIHAGEIRVQVEDGVVTLTGTVPTGLDERYAEAIAESVPGVRSVHSNLVVAPT